MFHSRFETGSIKGFSGSNGGDRAFVVDDPLLGAARKVVTFDVRSTDINSGYPRSQLNTNKFFDPGEDYWFGFGVNIPAETLAFPSPPPEKFNQMMLFEIYGPPYGKGGPNRLYINEGQFQFKGDGRTVWSAPVPPGAWVDFAVHYKLSSDPAVGYVALAVNDGTGWTQVPLSGSVSHADSGEHRLYYATHKAGTNNGDSNYATIKLSYSESFLPLNPYPISRAVVHITDLRIGSSANVVDPRSFANGTRQPAPVATGPIPQITGTPEVGSTLSATAGEWGPGEVALAYRWYVGGKAVPGSAGEAPTFVVRPEDVGQTVTAWVSGSGPGLQPFTRMSAQTSVVTAPIPEVEPPAEPPVEPPVDPPVGPPVEPPVDPPAGSLSGEIEPPTGE